ncbi:hypothetical protein H0H92_004112 [Tricholoma furcatifolium]|nr:hypothetical protein H0H92_004112 [Tricholoma furcatifolium]
MRQSYNVWALLAIITGVFSSAKAQGDLQSNLSADGIDASFPGDSTYATASSSFNLRFSYQPAAVTYPKTQQEVSEVVKLGAAYNMTVVARSGGHSYIANGLGGKNGALVVDLTNFNTITVDSTSGAATIGSGNRLGDIATNLADAGRALPHGTCAYVGIGGHASYGGYGFTSRMWGLTLDTITAVNTVLANGTIVRATADNYPDLFWGLRGSASSYGITTSVEVATFTAPDSATVFNYEWNMNADDAVQALSAYQSFVQTNIPDYFGMEVNIGRGSSAGTISFTLVGGWYAPVSGLNSTLGPLLAQLPPGPTTSLQTGTYLDSVRILAGGSLDVSSPDTHDTFYAKSLMTPESEPMNEQALTAFVGYLANQGFSSPTVELYGGTNSAINAVAPDATAFAHRSSMYTIQFYASSPNYEPPYPSYGFQFLDDMVSCITSNEPEDWDYGAYPNYIDDQLPNWQKLYYGSHYDRLKSLKEQYDPRDVYDFPTAIEE